VASDLDSVSDDVYESLVNDKAWVDFTRTSWYRPLLKQFKDHSAKMFMKEIESKL